MLSYLLAGLIGILAGFAIGVVVLRVANSNKYKKVEQSALERARNIEREALKNTKTARYNLERDIAKKLKQNDVICRKKIRHIERRNVKARVFLEKRFNDIGTKEAELSREKDLLDTLKEELKESQNECKNKLIEASSLIEKVSGYTKNEAKEIVLKQTSIDIRDEIANLFRKKMEIARKNISREVGYLISQAATRYAGDFVSERLINVVNLPDELKGRIIGKDGRNIKTLEKLMGVDVIIDDTPGVIVLSSFNLYRRAIATKVVEMLIESGRIQPARIESIYSKVKDDFDKDIAKDGEEIVADLGIRNIHSELIKLIGKLKFRASYGQNALAHSLEVAHLSGIMTAELGGDDTLAKRAGLLHDIGKALTHEYSGSHVDLGADLCRRYGEGDVVLNAIYAHHEVEEPKSIEAATVCIADTLSAARPGARREVLESFLKRVKEIENIATSKRGVSTAYAISSGKEVRVIVNAKLINDNEAILLSSEIAKDIEKNVQYPSEIKVNVIRELRAVEFAR